MTKPQVYCVGHIHPKEQSCLTCFIDGENARCRGYEPVSCLGHLSKDLCTSCSTCDAGSIPEDCRYVRPLHAHEAIAFKFVKARMHATIARAQGASPPDSSCYLG